MWPQEATRVVFELRRGGSRTWQGRTARDSDTCISRMALPDGCCVYRVSEDALASRQFARAIERATARANQLLLIRFVRSGCVNGVLRLAAVRRTTELHALNYFHGVNRECDSRLFVFHEFHLLPC